MIRHDILYALRVMRRSPVFTAVAALSLALGIGANTAIFSLINTLMFRTLPVRHPEQLVEMLHKLRGEPDPRGNGFSFRNWQYLREQNHVFSDLIAGSESVLHVRGEGFEFDRVPAQYVDPNFFQSLGVQAAVGRMIGDDRAVAVLSWASWKSRFHGDPAVLGKTLVVEDVPVTVIGVAPPDFHGWVQGFTHDLWLPLALEPTISHRPGLQVQLVGRLKPGVSLDQSLAEMSVLDRRIIEDSPKGVDNPYLKKVMLQMEPAGAGLAVLRDKFAKPLGLLMAVVGLMLLIACTNVAGMLLARGAAREREMAIRVAIGASRFRLVRQTLIESTLLSLAGALPALLLAYVGSAVLLRIIASGRDRIELHVQPDAHVLLFTSLVAVLGGLLFGLAPALRAMAATPISSLRAAGRSGETRVGKLLGKGLVVAQVAFSMVLLCAANAFIGHLSNLEHLDIGFRKDNLLLVSLDTARSGYTREQLSHPFQDLLKRFESIPGVRSATLSGATPISGAGASRSANVEGYQAKPGEVRFIQENWVAPKFFETYGTPILAGRDFTPQDEGQRVAIVNQTMARYYFGNASPLGMHVRFDGDDNQYTIIGMAGDANYRDLLEKSWRTIYFNTFEQNRPGSQFTLRTSVDPASLSGAVRRTVREALKTVSVAKITTMDDQIDASIVTERLIGFLSGLFGVLGALLAALGLYGLLEYTVNRRINEIGIRMALGATRNSVIRMVLGGSLAMAGAGLLIGTPLALWGRRFAANVVDGLPKGSVAPIVFGCIGMFAVAVFAAWIPARRAARVGPIEALRYE